MELEGVLKTFDYRILPKHLTVNTKTSISVRVEFSEGDLHSPDADDGEPYIGTINLHDWLVRADQENALEILCSVEILLPVVMFQQLRSMDGRCIKFETVHDIVIREPEKPTDFNAFIKRCSFEVGEEVDKLGRKLHLDQWWR